MNTYFLKKILEFSFLICATLLLAATWLVLAQAIIAVWNVFKVHGLSIIRILLDAAFAYSALLAFGLSACSLILVSKFKASSKFKFIFAFRITFFLCLILFVPVLVTLCWTSLISN